MTINFEQEYDKDLSIDYESIADKVINAALDYEKCPYEAEISLTLTNDEGIHIINNEFRKIDRPTDVLSFPMVDYDTPGEFGFLDETDEYFNPESGEEQAKAYGHSVTREFAFLIAHSMLHLMGYDHMEKDEEEIMEKKQEEILNLLGIGR